MTIVPIRHPPSTKGSERSERPPFSGNDQSASVPPAPPPEVYQLMAAAQMHREGRLLAPTEAAK
jgi:hypothetical protein